jgi:hypothetical protein
MEIISGYEGASTDKFIAMVKKIWKEKGKSERSGKIRYEIIIGDVTKKAIFVPTVSTRAGMETVIIWSLSQENMNKIEEEAAKDGIPVSHRSYLWLGQIPSVLPG